MVFIELDDVSVDFPVYNATSRSLKNQVMNLAVGGIFRSHHNDHMVIRGLDNISCTINEGERIGLVGHNGSGKTTLLRVLTGIYAPVSGQMRSNGEIASLIDTSLGIDPESTGRENIHMRAAIMRISPAKLKDCFDDIIAFSELGNYIDMPVRTYSSGMQLRLAFSVSTALEADILIMDEWLAVGDQAFKQKVNARLSNLLDRTKILVLASHSKALLSKVCNRIIWLEHGCIKMDGPAEKVIAAYFDQA